MRTIPPSTASGPSQVKGVMFYQVCDLGDRLRQTTEAEGLFPVEESLRMSPWAETGRQLRCLERVMRRCAKQLGGARILLCNRPDVKKGWRWVSRSKAYAIFVPEMTAALAHMHEYRHDAAFIRWQQRWLPNFKPGAAHA